MFKVNNKDTYFTPCSSVSIVNFEQAIAGWKSNKWIKMPLSFIILGNFQQYSIQKSSFYQLSLQNRIISRMKKKTSVYYTTYFSKPFLCQVQILDQTNKESKFIWTLEGFLFIRQIVISWMFTENFNLSSRSVLEFCLKYK